MICFRCGTEAADSATECWNCGQRFAGVRKTFTATTTSFRALEKRRLRARKATEKLEFGIGDVVRSRYEVKDLLGQGPLGVVYRVHDQEIEQDVALKVIHPALLTDGAEGFHRTIRRVRQLAQQNIVRIYDEAAQDEYHLFTMQLLEGLTLRKLLRLRGEKKENFSMQEAEPMLSQIAMALGHAHRTTVHGNLKPENVIVLPDVVKLTDFAAHEWVPAQKFVAAQEEAGSVHYLAPELRRAGPIDARADIYSLGATLYEMLTGLSFSADGPKVSEAVETASGVGGTGTKGIDELIARATAASPRDRFATIEQFSEALSMQVDADELSSIDISAAGLVVSDSDVTQRVMAPRELRDDAVVDAESSIEVTGERIAGKPPLPGPAPPPMAESEESIIEELSEDDLIESGESIELPNDDPLGLPELSPPEEVSFGATPPPGAGPPLGAEAPIAPMPPVAPSSPLLSKGMIAAVVGILVAFAAGTAIVLSMREPAPPKTKQVMFTSSGSAQPAEVIARSDATTPIPDPALAVRISDAALPPQPMAVDAVAVPLDTAVARDAEASKPVIIAAEPVVEPVIDAPRPELEDAPPPRPTVSEALEPARSTPEPPVKSVAEPVVAARVAAPSPKSETQKLPPQPVERVVEPERSQSAPAPVAKPAAPKPDVRPPEPVPEPPEPPSPEPPPPEPKPVKPVAGELRCPSAMALITTAKFPSGSVKRGVIKGAQAIAMAQAGKAYCVDAYEYPGRGRAPKVNLGAAVAESLCKSRGRRLCSDSEWRRACRGRGGAAFPYGNEFNGNHCNTEDEDGDERSLGASGRFRRCKSAWGVYDMSGNAAEWTSDRTVRGGSYASADEDAACDAGGRRAPATKQRSIGFRCCAEPK